MKKYCILAALFGVNLCLGGVYAWSIFVPDLVGHYGYTTAQTQVVFGSIVCCLTLTMLFAGRLENRFGPRLTIVTSAVLMLSSYFVGSLSGPHFLTLWLGCGVISGMSIGFGYVCTLAVSLRWFGQRKGFACGMVLAGYGLGAILLSSIAQRLLTAGWDVMSIFRFVGIAYGAMIGSCALVITNPAGYCRKTLVPTLDYSSVFRRPRFIVLALSVGLGTLPGLMFIGNLKPIAFFFGYDNTVAVIAIGLVAMGNSFGRIAGGSAHDRFKASAIKVILAAITIGSLLLLTGDVHKIVFWIIIMMSGISYGALIANIPAQVSEEFGHENFGKIFPVVLLTHGLTALFAAPLGGWIYDTYSTYRPAMVIAAGVGAVCFGGFFIAYRKINQPLPVV